jgi:hypothetical protein
MVGRKGRDSQGVESTKLRMEFAWEMPAAESGGGSDDENIDVKRVQVRLRGL